MKAILQAFPHTLDRFQIWGEKLRVATGLQFAIPQPVELGGVNRITFDPV